MNAIGWNWSFALSTLPALLVGFRLTVLATLLGSALAFVLGLALTLLRMTRHAPLTLIVNAFVSFVRGTPLLVQLYVLFYVLPKWGVSTSAFVTGVVGLGVYYSASTSEVYRAGIEGVAPGQWEAALTLGLPIRRVWSGVILPQAMRAVLPVLGNQVVAMFKETSLLSTITVMEMLAQATNIGSIQYRYVEPLTLAGALYFVISYVSAKGLRRLEVGHVNA
ncbi:ectoine/hydroxyectoine ABC transporter permease subunit EhuD [Paraburkholderia sp. ZP32-5]|uniref:ectoine/hydroxyectoine ABC transporter permease subunit EhuD n=1 Tax=Paraburkholderia sp. ZP32-5 TaxID=2883245 RepID=UPI001F25A2F9|nr:ectoine/hydroxyectoine ABC transporter permease subunit EhuD [Paraburkholderia sp. ZP32-5]